MRPEVAVVGATSWGTTLAVVLARTGVPTALVTRTPEEADALDRERENRRLLPGVRIPEGVLIAPLRPEALEGAWLVVLAVPSRTMRENARRLAPLLRRGQAVLSASKGLEADTGLRMSQVLAQELPPGTPLAVLSGPNLAREIAEGLPASTVVASEDEATARRIQALLNSRRFRVYTSEDVVGVELGGALKNIVAIGAGICDGLGYGANAKSALLTRGLAEITRLGVALGANPLTFSGLAGLGDLVATCFSPLSRNRRVGEELGRGRPLDRILADLGHIAEGVDTTRATLPLARSAGVEMPILETIHAVLFEGLPLAEAVHRLMGRPPRPEWPSILVRQVWRNG